VAQPVLKQGGGLLGKEGVVCIVIAFEQPDAPESGNLQDGSFQEKPMYRGRKLQSVMKETFQRRGSCRQRQVPGRAHSCKFKTRMGNGKLIYFLSILVFNHL